MRVILVIIGLSCFASSSLARGKQGQNLSTSFASHLSQKITNGASHVRRFSRKKQIFIPRFLSRLEKVRFPAL